MIPLVRPDLPPDLARDLKDRELATANSSGAAVRTKWRGARATRSSLLAHLTLMAAGLGQCMYCGESRGTSIDHFEPIARAPQRAFDWLNHLLACSHCNSNEKREQYPCDASGCCMLVDPSMQDPRDHLWLRLTTGCYEPRTEIGSETIRVFGLNRELLPRGRLAAFHVRRAVLRDALARGAAGEGEEMATCLQSLAEQPFADVLYAMVDAAERPGAVEVLGRDVVEMLKRPEVLRLVWPH